MREETYQMFQSLIERRSNKHTSAQRPTSMSLIHSFISVTLISHRMKTGTDIIYRDIGKGGCVTLETLEDYDLSKETFNKLGDSHSRWNSVWIDNDIWDDTFGREGHVFLAVCHTNGSFLPVPRCLLSVLDMNDKIFQLSMTLIK